jgi:hypothetical protein
VSRVLMLLDVDANEWHERAPQVRADGQQSESKLQDDNPLLDRFF